MSVFVGLSGLNCAKEISSILSRDYNLIQVCGYAARKGTREKARKKKVKVEVVKVGFIPHKLREKTGHQGPFISKRVRDDFKKLPIDDVWVQRFHQWRVFDFPEAVECHRETHHPEMYNQPKAPIHAFIELDMTGVKKNKFVEPFTRISSTPNHFNHGEDRSILVFCKTPELRQQAEDAGATLVGDVDLLKKVEKGDLVLPDFHFILAHPNILPEMVSIRGLLKRNFPNPKLGTLGINIGEMVTNFRTGIQYRALRDESQLDYGWIDASIGTLNMGEKDLEENFAELINDISSMKPKRQGAFITRAFLKSSPSKERLKLNLEPFLGKEAEKENYDSESDDEAPMKAKA